MNRNQRYLIKKNLFCPTRKCGWDEDINIVIAETDYPTCKKKKKSFLQ